MVDEQIVNVLAVIGALTVLFFLFKLIGSFHILNYYIITRISKVPISLPQLIFMRFRKVDLGEVVKSYIILSKGDVKVEVTDLEVAYLAGHNLSDITIKLVPAKKEGVSMTIQQAIEESAVGSNS